MRDVNKPGTSISTLLNCGTLYFSGSCSPSTGVLASERKITEALLFRFSTAKELLFLAFLLSSFFLLDFDTLVLEPIEQVALYFSERNTDWNNEDYVSSLTAHKLGLYLKQHNLQVSGGKATLVARVQRYVRDAQQILKPQDSDATSDSELQSSDSEDPDDSEDDAQPDSSEMGNFIEHSYGVLFVALTLMSNALQCKAQVKDSGIFPIFVGGGGGGGGVIIFGKFGGGSELICLY